MTNSDWPGCAPKKTTKFHTIIAWAGSHAFRCKGSWWKPSNVLRNITSRGSASDEH